MPKLVGMRENMHAAIYFDFDFREGIEPVTRGVINSINFPGTSKTYDEQRGKTRFQLITDRTLVGLGLFLCPHLAMGKYSPEVITHIGPSKIVVTIGDKDRWDFPPGALSMQAEGRMKPGKPAHLSPRTSMHIEWRIIDDDIPPPILFTVGFEGIVTREVL
jgi:hypothetical protein